jgi:3-phosphoshikimate 1-carboxyvinyltransferase
MDVIVKATDFLSGEVKAPPSKSYTHRAIMMAGLAEGTSKIHDPLLSADPLASINALRAAGAEINIKDSELEIMGNSGEIKVPTGIVDVHNSGTTIRIMTSVFALCGEKVTLTGDSSIQKRPMQPLLDALRQMGVETSSTNGNPPVTIKGSIKSSTCKIRGDLSSQYISGLLMALPLARGDSRVEIEGELKSRPYLDLTFDMLTRFGGEVKNNDYKSFEIPGTQTYKATDYTVEGDYSGAAFILAAAVLTNSKVTVRNLFRESRQGDKKIVEILQKMGAELEIGKDSVTVNGCNSLNGVEVDLSQTPDLLPIMAVLGALAKGETRIYNVEHARIKECDRIDAMSQGLRKMGAEFKENPDGFIFRGVEMLKGTKLKTFNDHRIVMALAVAGLRAKGETLIKDAESVAVSFPNFIGAMCSLGANFNEEASK